ncbi:MAG: CrcB family protein [Acidimicrobiia bacterium]
MSFLVTAVSGALGAIARYGVSGLAQRWTRSGFPVGTMTVNLTGALALGALMGVGRLDSTVVLALAGFLSGFTTFSTWMMETVWLGIGSGSVRAWMNLMLTLLGGIALAGIGYSLFN